MIFNYTHGSKFDTIHTESTETDFYNLKNRAEGARRYGYIARVVRCSNPEGQVAFFSEYQTTLNGSRYQSSKRSEYFSTEAEARAASAKTVAGAMKRYAKLATDPSSQIERRA